jgi:GH15 family glucan-1,4-alpha-glucosidase
MTYAPTGGLVAASTAALPEQVGGERNWDYRYTWIRDASFSVGALLSIGFVDETEQFGAWLGDRIRERAGGESGPLNIMYRVDGSSDLKEEVLEPWSGYRGSRPVWIGNGAADQLQLDIYGEAMDSIFAGHRGGLQVPDRVGCQKSGLGR